MSHTCRPLKEMRLKYTTCRRKRRRLGNGSTVQRFNGSTVQRFNGSTVQRFNCSTVQWFNGSTVQRFNGSTVQLFNGSMVQRFNGSTVQRFKCSSALGVVKRICPQRMQGKPWLFRNACKSVARYIRKESPSVDRMVAGIQDTPRRTNLDPA